MAEFDVELLRNINLCSTIHQTHKKNILNKLIYASKDLAPQGSIEWLADRLYNIGGSEMSTITGDNPYSKIDKLVAQKVGLTSFNGNIATRWGQLFENVTQRITEIIFDISDGIKETGSLQGAVPNQKYSPDGLAVVKIKCAETIYGQKIETDEYCIILFEFKSPLISIPDGKIPKHYLPQVKTGLCSINIADFALYISNMFRKCAFEDLGLSANYDYGFHNKDKIKITEPLAFGMILFFQTDRQKQKFYDKYEAQIKPTPEVEFNYDSDSSDECGPPDNINIGGKFCLGTNYVNELYRHIYGCAELNYMSRDFGKRQYGEFNDLLELISNDYASVEYCEPHILKAYDTNLFLSAQNIKVGSDEFSTTIEYYKQIIDAKSIKTGEIIFGYLPWKLMKSDIIYECRDPLYVSKYSEKIRDTINIIKSINETKTQNDKISKFKECFPNSRIIQEESLDTSYMREFLPKNI